MDFPGEGEVLVTMTRDEILQAFDRMRVWQRGDQRAVHKPLLVLFALAKVIAGGTAMMDWNNIEPKLKELLEEFGPDGSGNSRHYPFWHLKTDGLWQLDGPTTHCSTIGTGQGQKAVQRAAVALDRQGNTVLVEVESAVRSGVAIAAKSQRTRDDAKQCSPKTRIGGGDCNSD